MRPSMRPYIPKATFAFCHSLLASRLLPSVASPAAPLLPVQALLTTAGLLPRHPDLSLLALNSLLRALSRRAASPSHPRLALRLLGLMLAPAAPLPAPDHLSFPFALSAAAAALDDTHSPGAGQQLHALLTKIALFPSDHYVTTALIQLYAPRPDLARRVFDGLPRREAIHYDLVIGAYARAGLPVEGLAVFRAMFEDGAAPDAVVLTTAVATCAQAGALDCGAWVHRYVERTAPGLLGDAFVGSALVSMYAKCGCLEQAVRVFDGMPERNEYVWGTMVGAFAVHGMAAQAIACLERMTREDGVRPDGVAVLGALSACAHAGKVEDGLRLLKEMRSRYGVAPGHEHYSCTVDMLCRVGRLEVAVGLIETMPMTPLASVWGSVLAGCRNCGNVELAEVAARELEKLGGSADEGVYIQLSNIYLDANRKDDARRVRKLIGSRGIKKVPAYSAVEVDGEVSSFVADDQAHPRRFEIWEVLRLLADQMGRKPDEEEDFFFFLHCCCKMRFLPCPREKSCSFIY
ncbi:putative pentatricopeptide repeat-containing protein At3g28640 [Phragmites australis]|uniref:putative pentatricopeptide repeat-containing protein At3g28640 n=1 Tax=Phragmites australis TaxID=29695 RepID=UPI002D7A1DED|nr:putative pentatricopeptide repeat-containing protein At3g28640 [Phragmites australis]